MVGSISNSVVSFLVTGLYHQNHKAQCWCCLTVCIGFGVKPLLNKSNIDSLWPSAVIYGLILALVQVFYSAPSHYLNQFGDKLIWTSVDLLSVLYSRTIFGEIRIKIKDIFFQENAFENVVSNMGGGWGF